MKKVLALLLALTMVLALAACGNSSQSSDNTASTTPSTSTSTGSGSSTASTEPAATQEHYDLFWGGTSASSGYYALNVACTDIINKYVDNVSVTLVETGGTVDDYKLMRDGEASFAQTSSVNEYCLQNNVAAYEDFGFTDSYDLCFFVPQAYYFVVAKDSGITNVEQLAGKKYNAGLAGSSSEVETMNILSNALGIEPDWYPASTADAVDAISNRQIVGFTKSGTSLSPETTIAGLQASIDIDVLDFTPEQAKTVSDMYPYYGFKEVSGDLFGLDHDFLTYCSNFGFSVSKDLPEEVVYEIIKALDEHSDEIRASYPGIVDDPVALTADPTDSSLIHPGVVKYMQEKGIDVPANRIPG